MLHPPRLRRASGSRRAGVLAGVGISVLALALAGCTAGQQRAASSATSSSAAPAPRTSPTTPPAALAITPAANTAEVNPGSPIVVKTTGGMIGKVVVTAADGTEVPGALAADSLSWTSKGPLAYATTYTVDATASNLVGQATSSQSTFTTVKPANFTLPYVNTAAGFSIQDGNTYGVGQALQIHWDEEITDRAAAQKAVTVTTSPPQTAAFSWTDDQNMMWRTKDYLKPGTKVTVTANVYGVQVGPGLWGQKNVSSSFVIGDSHISIADDTTKIVTVYENGKVVRTMPTSMGQGGRFTSSNGTEISLWTNSGPHMVIQKAETVRMTSSSYGLPKTDPLGYDTVVKYGVKISQDGEYTHAAPWNNNLGQSDESHGCLNLSTDDAEWMYNFSLPGDIVDVKGTPQNLAEWNSGSWTVPWDQWIARSALPVG
ncbi:L,D-transpeptidase [Jatrophihabitans sp. YIM 134969]